MNVEFLALIKEFGELLVPYATLATFTLGLHYLTKKENRLMSQCCFFLSSFSFATTVLVLGMIKLFGIESLAYEMFTFLVLIFAVMGLWGGIIMYIIPFERILKIQPKKKKLSQP